jgi:predicted nucleic acid-binding protein
MAGSPKRVSWDACTWIALIQKEKILDDGGKVIEDRYSLARSVIELASRGKIEIATSGLCLAEVCKNPPDAAGSEDKVAPFFEHDYVLIVPVDTAVGTVARRLMLAKHAGLKPLDSVHLATALAANVDELHTFDERLLALDEKLTKNDGTALKICKPAHGGPLLPLLDGVEREAKEADASAEDGTGVGPTEEEAPTSGGQLG